MSISAILQAAERVVLTLWVGGLWMAGLVVAPVLFRSYERMVAGEIAGRLFAAVSFLGMVCAVLLLAFVVARARQRVWRDWRAGVLVVMLTATVIGEFGLAVRMRELKELMILPPVAPAVLSEFGRLHGIASLLFLANSALGLALVIFGIRPRVQAGN
jgi:small-conductance mechanosensitive channel